MSHYFSLLQFHLSWSTYSLVVYLYNQLRMHRTYTANCLLSEVYLAQKMFYEFDSIPIFRAIIITYDIVKYKNSGLDQAGSSENYNDQFLHIIHHPNFYAKCFQDWALAVSYDKKSLLLLSPNNRATPYLQTENLVSEMSFQIKIRRGICLYN